MVALTGAGAYAAIQAQADKALGAGKAVGGAGGGDGPGFGDLLKQVMSDAVGQSKAAETAMTNQVQGKAEMVDVVTAISSAETSLETMMAVRDQVIAAYQEIMRMPI
ncbi:MAG: flagellar hook-basal body complex protein FliE [Alphaproteobacteria bacterium]